MKSTQLTEMFSAALAASQARDKELAEAQALAAKLRAENTQLKAKTKRALAQRDATKARLGYFQTNMNRYQRELAEARSALRKVKHV